MKKFLKSILLWLCNKGIHPYYSRQYVECGCYAVDAPYVEKMKMSQQPILSEVPDPNACSNCVALRWGPEEGWDKCGRHGFGIDWAGKTRKVCVDHERSNSKDPRNPEVIIESFDDWYKFANCSGNYNQMKEAWDAALKYGAKK